MAKNRDTPRSDAIRQVAAERVESVWKCVSVLRPDLSLEDRKELARKFLDLGTEDYRPPPAMRISPAQITEMVWRNCQCANRHCSIVLFSNELADELNEFFYQNDSD